MIKATRRLFLDTAAGALAATLTPWPTRAMAATSCTWDDLGYRSEDSSGRAWFAVPRRAKDGKAYIYSGTTNGKNHLLRWEPAGERWVIHKRGNEGASDGRDKTWFPWPGAEYPAAVDNGFAVWDNVADELWVNCVNPSAAPAIYNPATDRWRQVTSKEFPSVDLTRISRAFNGGCASSPDYLVIYGGHIESPTALLHVFDGRRRVWTYYPNHGVGDGKPGVQQNIQGQLQWIPFLDAFLLYAGRRVFTLSLDWKWQLRPTTGEPPSMAHRVCAVPLPDGRAIAVVGGDTLDVSILDIKQWTWTKLAGEKAPGSKMSPPTPRLDGAAWAERQGLYIAWGQESNAPAELIRRTFVCRELKGAA